MAVRHIAMKAHATGSLTLHQVLAVLRDYHVYDTAAHIVRVQSLAWLLQCTIAFLACVAVTIGVLYAVKKMRQADRYDDPGAYVFAYLVCGFVGLLGLTIATSTYANPWLWMGFTHPHLAFAHEVFQRLLAHGG